VRKSASPRFALSLAIVSIVVILYISFVTLGQGKQSRVEARLGDLVTLAESASIPCPALIALCVAESHRDPMRSDSELAFLLAKELDGKSSIEAVGEAIHRLYTDEVQRNLVVDLWEVNRKRWLRLVAERGDS
jgi:hypothetical protein